MAISSSCGRHAILLLLGVFAACSPSPLIPLGPIDVPMAGDATADQPQDALTPPADAASDAPPSDVLRDGPCRAGVACAPGQYCDLTRQRCVDCLSPDHCTAATPVCASGRCVAAVACTTSRNCPGQVCDLTRMRCVDCVADMDCGTGQRCISNVCATVTTCRSSRDCSAMGLVCDLTRSQCVECNADNDCPTGRYCATGNVCATTVCTPGARSCASSVRTRVCDMRGASATETDCAVGDICMMGECRRLLCSPGTLSCESTSARRTCNADGMGYTVAACAAGESCTDGMCRRTTCTPGAANCASASTRQVCNPDGVSFTTTPCPSGQTCVGGTCSTPEPPAPMITARVDHALVSLPDGRVLAVGGYVPGVAPTRNVELYDPVTNRWQARAQALSNFSRTRAILLQDGRVAVSSGNGVVDVYTPSTDTWSHLTSWSGLATGPAFTITHEQDGRVYALDLGAGRVFSYLIASGMWREGSPPVGVRLDSGGRAVADMRGRIHVFGGIISGVAFETVHCIYVSSTDAWTIADPFAAGRYTSSFAVAPDGRAYVTGGVFIMGSARTLTARTDLLDLTSNVTTPLAPMPEARFLHASVVLSDGRLLVTGGYLVEMTGTTVPPAASRTLIYTPTTNTWR